MGKVKELEGQVRDLSASELAAFREWFAKYDAEVWDRQFESDVRDGKLDRLAKRALSDHRAGRSTQL
jgi:hypothetical protein